MKQQFMKSALATAVLGAAMLAAGGAVAGSIVNTKHNLGAAGTGPNSVAETEEICIFCHTPHGGDNGAPVPLWNKVLSNPANFKTYDQLGTSTYDAAQASIGSVTLACLTCHDGTQAIDNIINAPGSGGYDPTGGGVNGLGWTWTSTDNSLDANGRFNPGPDTGGNVIFNLGTDLTNDHPVSMQYGGGGVSASSAGPTRDADFKLPDKIGATDRWYIDNVFMGDNSPTSTTGAFDVWDFKLYTRDTSGWAPDARGVDFAGENEPFVECGSCHDPHLETTTFLRIDPALNGGASNNGSRICLACHTK